MRLCHLNVVWNQKKGKDRKYLILNLWNNVTDRLQWCKILSSKGLRRRYTIIFVTVLFLIFQLFEIRRGCSAGSLLFLRTYWRAHTQISTDWPFEMKTQMQQINRQTKDFYLERNVLWGTCTSSHLHRPLSFPASVIGSFSTAFIFLSMCVWLHTLLPCNHFLVHLLKPLASLSYSFALPCLPPSLCPHPFDNTYTLSLWLPPSLSRGLLVTKPAAVAYLSHLCYRISHFKCSMCRC